MSELRITVRGVPAPQGSKRFVRTAANGKGIMVESSAKVKPWRQDVRAAAVEAIAAGAPTFPTGGVIVGMAFRFARPKTHYRSGRYAHLLRPSAPPTPSVKPDLSKLVRSTEDALTQAGAYHDDAQIVAEWSTKGYDDRGEGIGATIIVRAAEEGAKFLRLAAVDGRVVIPADAP